MFQYSSVPATGPNSGFPFKLFRMLEDDQCTSLKWNSLGNAALVFCNDFKKEFLSETPLRRKYHLKTTSVTSFVRQLHAYGFRKVNEESDEFGPENSIQRCYSHPCFHKNKPELLVKMKRNARKKKSEYMQHTESNSCPGSPAAYRISPGILGDNMLNNYEAPFGRPQQNFGIGRGTHHMFPFAPYDNRRHPVCRVPPYTNQFQVPTRDPNQDILRLMANALASQSKPSAAASQIIQTPTFPQQSPCHEPDAGSLSPEVVPKTPCLSPTPSSSASLSPKQPTLRERAGSTSPEHCPVTPSHSNPDSDVDYPSDPDEPLDLSQGSRKSQAASICRVDIKPEPPTPPKELNLSPFLSLNASALSTSTHEQLQNYLQSLTPNLNGTNRSTCTSPSGKTASEFELVAPIIQPAYISWQASTTYCPKRKRWINRRSPTVIPLPINRFENFTEKEETKAEGTSNYYEDGLTNKISQDD